VRRPGRPLTVVAVLAIGLALRLGFIWNGPLDLDESQHLHDAWLVAHGPVVYVDFWEHHSPLFYYVVAPLTRLFTDSAYVYLTAHGLMLAITGVAFVLLYLALRRLRSSLALWRSACYVFRQG
jgi:predicted membrane-bound mannosyltransferase